MMLVSGPLLPLVALVWPLALGALVALPRMRANGLAVLPLAPLPALLLALTGSDGETRVPELLLGVVLSDDPTSRLLLGMTAAVWLAAGLYAQVYMRDTRRPAVFGGFWCLTLAGNLGVFLATDVITFYCAFAAVSLAAYFLVVAEGGERALRAGRVYIVLAVVGEVCLLVAFLVGAEAAGSLKITDMREALPAAPLGSLAVLLLVIGFGLKAGLVPLHVWLPLAHPAAPTPASAVLSGAIVKAGVIGMMLFLPLGFEPLVALTALGLAAGVGAAVYGLTQDNPKTILAYSTISQMGIVVAMIAATVQAGTSMAPATLYAAHHGLAKGALFLCVGVMAASDRHWRVAILALTALAASSVAGLPLTGGALAKAASKPGLPWVAEQAFAFSAVTTTLVLVWFLRCLWQQPSGKGEAAAPAMGLSLPAAALVLAALALPWVLWPDWSGMPDNYPLQRATLWAGLWPIMIGGGIAALGLKAGLRAPRAPEGDMLPWIERAGAVWHAGLRRTIRLPASLDTAEPVAWTAMHQLRDCVLRALRQVEMLLAQWQWSGVAILLLVIMVALG